MPRILLQQGTNLVNKFALLLHKCRFAQDSRDKPENDGSWRCWLSICCKLFNHPSPAQGEVLNNITFKGLDVVRQYAALLERRVQSSTRVRKFLADGVQCGRSMIEMLGVLAIIAVLSVGGIAGYSKAMLAYKSNIQRNLLSELLHAMIEIKPKLGTNLAEFQNITYLVDSLGYLPEGTTYENNTIYDKSGNRYEIHKYNKDNGKYYVMEIYFENKENSFLSIGAEEFCHNMIWAIKPIIPEIYSINFWQGNENGYYTPLIFYHSNSTQTTLTDIQTKCHLVTIDKGRDTHFSIHLWP